MNANTDVEIHLTLEAPDATVIATEMEIPESVVSESIKVPESRKNSNR